MRVLVLGRAAWQTAGGGSGGKLQSWETRCSADGRIKDRRLGGGVEDEGISPDDVGKRGAGIGTGLILTGVLVWRPVARDRRSSACRARDCRWRRPRK